MFILTVENGSDNFTPPYSDNFTPPYSDNFTPPYSDKFIPPYCSRLTWCGYNIVLVCCKLSE